ncbi:MAG: tRNA (adenosine(37)-N6)-dimethylallyltransferase MiaA [Bacteroidales bacterium]|jgi:tRNA dimethylallyltransferase|nr:tRNA (adenosine(37)-N6)-dimethylallyltransferase MiaA [Bacteroidales bacterium]
MINKRLIVLVGSTAVGKTKKAIELAKHFETEIVSADSRQFYKELKIGVASPTMEEQREVRHHFVGNISIYDSYNAATYATEALQTVEHLFQSHNTVILTGGSGMYIKALCDGIDLMPDANPQIREELNQIFAEQGIKPLQEELMNRDPQYYDIVDTNNHIRLIRALEVCRSTGKPYSSFRRNTKTKHWFEIEKVGILRSRESLINRINLRVDDMIAEGLIDEAYRFHNVKHLQAMNTVGYKELFDYFDQKTTLEKAIENIKTNTRQYAKRQMTWFRKDKAIRWFDLDKEDIYVD